jgi:WD40 repeat protein
LICLFSLAACSPAATTLPASLTATQLPATLSATRTRTPSPTLPSVTASPSATPDLKATILFVPSPTLTPTDLPTPQALKAPGQSSIQGTALPAGRTAITADNLGKLANTARWGRGMIDALAFAPDGTSFAVSSTYGAAVFQMDQLNQPPAWIGFDQPIYHWALSYSPDGLTLGVVSFLTNHFINLKTGQLSDQNPASDWALPEPYQMSDRIAVTSEDGSLRFLGGAEGNPRDERNNWMESETRAFGKVVDVKSDQVLYQLKDQPRYLTLKDRRSPEGCELDYFSACGNAMMDRAWIPYRAIFSQSNQTIAVMYRIWDYSFTEDMSVVRVYDGKDGSLLASIGELNQPVIDFAFQPQSEALLVAFLNGSVQLWQARGEKLLYQSWAFSPPPDGFQFSADGRYTVLHGWPDQVEVRRTLDGSVVGEYRAVTFALSPISNHIALGSADGKIQVEDLDSQKTTARMNGHTGKILSLVFSPDGKLLISSSQDCSMRAWNAQTGEYLHPFEEVAVDPYGFQTSRIFVYQAGFLPGTNRLMGFGSWGTVVNWDVNSGAKNYSVQAGALQYYNGMMTIQPHFPSSVSLDIPNVQFSIGDKTYDLTTGQEVNSTAVKADLPDNCEKNGPVSKDGKLMFTRGINDLEGQICVRDAVSQRLLWRIPVIDVQGQNRSGLAYPYLSPDGTLLAVPTSEGLVYIFQVVP